MRVNSFEFTLRIQAHIDENSSIDEVEARVSELGGLAPPDGRRLTCRAPPVIHLPPCPYTRISCTSAGWMDKYGRTPVSIDRSFVFAAFHSIERPPPPRRRAFRRRALSGSGDERGLDENSAEETPSLDEWAGNIIPTLDEGLYRYESTYVTGTSLSSLTLE